MHTLQAHISSSLTDLPIPLSKPLGKLNLHSVNETAVSLSRLLARLNPGHDVLRLPVPPTACAIFILALEGDLRVPLNPLGDIAKCLGARHQVAKNVVMTRYKIIQDEIASWVENLPWLDKYETKGGRAKVSRRLVVARGLKDVIRFQEDIWQQRSKPTLPSELLVEGYDPEHSHEIKIVPSRPKGRNPNRAMVQSMQFLLDPLGTPVPAFPTPSPRSARTSLPQLSLATYLLTSPSASASSKVPTRLQLLACLRGGSSEEKIRDEELFAEGELENFLRDENEVRILRETFEWDEEYFVEESHTGKRKRTNDLIDSADVVVIGSAFRPRKTRLNMKALAQFMSEDHHTRVDAEQFMGLEEAIDRVDLDNAEQNSDEDLDEHKARPSQKRRLHSTFQLATEPITRLAVDAEAEGLVLNDWRPPSPGNRVTYDDSRYEEEYD